MLEQIKRRWPLKVLAAVSAYAIWLGVIGESNIVQDFNAPLLLQHDASLIEDSPRPQSVSLRVRGTASLIERIESVKLSVAITYGGSEPGERSLAIAPSNVQGLPRGVEILRIVPDRMTVSVDRRGHRQLPVTVIVSDEPPPGYHFYGARPIPSTIPIEGPRSHVDQAADLFTEPISLAGQTESFTVRVSAIPEDTLLQLNDPKPIEVQIEIDEDPVERHFEDLPVIPIGTLHDTSLQPESIDVIVSGPPDLIAGLLPAQIKVLADMAGKAPAAGGQTADISVQIDGLPPRVRGRLSASPTRQTVRVVVTERRTDTP